MAGDLALRSVFAFKKPIKCIETKKNKKIIIKNLQKLYTKIMIITRLYLIIRCYHHAEHRRYAFWQSWKGVTNFSLFNDGNNNYAQHVKCAALTWSGNNVNFGCFKCSIYGTLISSFAYSLLYSFQFFLLLFFCSSFIFNGVTIFVKFHCICKSSLFPNPIRLYQSDKHKSHYQTPHCHHHRHYFHHYYYYCIISIIK